LNPNLTMALVQARQQELHRVAAEARLVSGAVRPSMLTRLGGQLPSLRIGGAARVTRPRLGSQGHRA
jgi:phage terminase Nu1 subunit (DNA packaging protein)